MLLFLLVLIILALDQLTKVWAIRYLMGNNPIVVIPHIFQLTYTENRGAAFSLLQGKVPLFVFLTAVVLIAIVYALQKGVIHTNLGRLALTFIAGGALGNLIDRILHGYVVDMLYFNLIDFPVFNVADIFIVAGGILFAYYILVQHDKVERIDESIRESKD